MIDASSSNKTTYYQSRVNQFGEELATAQRNWTRLGNLRLIAAGTGLVIAMFAWYRDEWILLVGSALFALLYLILAILQRRRSGRVRQLQRLVEANQAGVARQSREWANLPLTSTWEPPATHPYASDIDLFGPASLFHLLDTTSTPVGQGFLQQWLLSPAAPDEIASRQEAVFELAPMVDFRQELAASVDVAAIDMQQVSDFISWSEEPSPPAIGMTLAWTVRLLSFLTILFGILDLVNLIALPLWALTGLVNILIYYLSRNELSQTISAARSYRGATTGYTHSIELITQTSWQSSWLQELHALLTVDEAPITRQIARLGRLCFLALPERTILHDPLQAIGWDVHLVQMLERWKRQNGDSVRNWINACGLFESISALANLRFDNEEWTMPALQIGYPNIDATQIGHPLISNELRICNDVTVGPKGSVLLVTGSNMSGKSTLLRAIGLNSVLAGAGGPVCAIALSMPPVELWTSARIRDSLASGTSFYMAELQRLKRIVDAAEAAPDYRPVLYLLDEVLQGTNTTERHIAAIHVIQTLIESGAIGAVSTHDLALASEPELKKRANLAHFTDQVTNDGDIFEMNFDFKLRKGLATSSNAIRLMQLLGFDIEPPQEVRH